METKKQRHLDHKRAQKDSTPAAGVYAFKIANTARKNLSHFTCFNSDKKDRYVTKYPKPKDQKHLTKTSVSTGNFCIEKTNVDTALGLFSNEFLIVDTRFDSGKMNIGFNGQYSQNSHEC